MKHKISYSFKITLFLLSIIFVMQNCTIVHGAEKAIDLERDKPIPAKVLEIIESNVYKLLVYDNNVPHVELYGLIGVKPNGNQAAYDYSVKKLLNKTVYFLEDPNIKPRNGVKFCYLYADFSISHNEDLINHGYALADDNFKSSKAFLSYLQSQKIAKNKSLGMFNFSDQKQVNRIININTATTEQIQKHFGIDYLHASRWNARISANPINNLNELRAMDHEFFTPEVLLEYAPSIHLRTNLQTALPYEINTLIGKLTNDSQITDKIMKYRLFKQVLEATDYNNIPIPEGYRKAMYPYITFKDQYYSFADVNKIINIRSANKNQIAHALGVNEAQAFIVYNFLKNSSYPIRNIQELFMPYFPLNSELKSMDLISDNIRIYTDINNAGDSEIRSLFGNINMSTYQYTSTIQTILNKRPFANEADLEQTIGKYYTNKIKDYIYFKDLAETDYVNLNTSDINKIAEVLGLSKSQKNQFHRPYINPKDLPDFLSVSSRTPKFTLYTNINRAGYNELYNLAPNMSKALVDDIIKQRKVEESFYSMEDIQKLFEKHNLQETYHKIKNYLILQ